MTPWIRVIPTKSPVTRGVTRGVTRFGTPTFRWNFNVTRFVGCSLRPEGVRKTGARPGRGSRARLVGAAAYRGGVLRRTGPARAPALDLVGVSAAPGPGVPRTGVGGSRRRGVGGPRTGVGGSGGQGVGVSDRGWGCSGWEGWGVPAGALRGPLGGLGALRWYLGALCLLWGRLRGCW